MAYPDWKDFEYIFKGNCNKPFEALARNLFKKHYGIGDILSYFKNHPGNETDTIQVGSDVIGFQAKYFEDTISTKDITASIETARKRNPDQTLMLIYTNMEFGIPKNDKTTGKPKDKTDKLKNIEAVAQKHHMKVEWIFGDNILDEKSIVGKEGKRVMIMGGKFEGVEGVIRRVKRCKRVVVASPLWLSPSSLPPC